MTRVTPTRTMQENPPHNPEETAPEVAFGPWLRRQREARGVSLREISDSTRISLRYLEALEEGRFDVLPAPVFARGFLREYARVVGLDPDEVVNAFLLVGTEGTAVTEEKPAPRRRFSNPWGYGLLLAAAMVVLLGVAVMLSFWAERRALERGDEPPSLVPAIAATAVPGSQRQDADDLAVTPEASPETPAPAGPPVNASPAEVAAVPDLSPRAALEAGPEVALAAPLVVEILLRDECWIEARVDGRRRPGELLAGGEAIVLEADSWVELTLGNRAAVDLLVNGRPFSLPASPGNVVRGVRIERPGAAGSAGGEQPR